MIHQQKNLRRFEALDLLVSCRSGDNDMVVNTSQSLNRMPHSDETSDLMCLTSWAQRTALQRELHRLVPASCIMSWGHLVHIYPLLVVASWLGGKPFYWWVFHCTSCICLRTLTRHLVWFISWNMYQSDCYFDFCVNLVFICCLNIIPGASQAGWKLHGHQNHHGGDMHCLASDWPGEDGASMCKRLVAGSCN